MASRSARSAAPMTPMRPDDADALEDLAGGGSEPGEQGRRRRGWDEDWQERPLVQERTCRTSARGPVQIESLEATTDVAQREHSAGTRWVVILLHVAAWFALVVGGIAGLV